MNATKKTYIELLQKALAAFQKIDIQAANTWLREWLSITFTNDRKVVVTPKWFYD